MQNKRVNLQALYQAWLACRRCKRGTKQAQRYELNLLDNLIETTDLLNSEAWLPSPFVCFVVQQPKWREIHAAQFKDRVVHHLLVKQLIVCYKGVFIDDVYSNISGKGTHKAVTRLGHFMRSQRACASNNNIDEPHYLQCDIRNFFYSIDKNILFSLLKKRLIKWQNKTDAKPEQVEWLLRLSWKIIFQPIAPFCLYEGDYHHCVPAHKQLKNVPQHKGLPIGNLTSQFFANVYMNELDQYVKHGLKCHHYLRYVDDFILVHKNKSQLLSWLNEIECFLKHTLLLTLKQPKVCRPLSQGADFLGYIIRADYRLVRARVVNNLRGKLRLFAKKLIVKRDKRSRLLLAPLILKQLEACFRVIGGILAMLMRITYAIDCSMNLSG